MVKEDLDKVEKILSNVLKTERLGNEFADLIDNMDESKIDEFIFTLGRKNDLCKRFLTIPDYNIENIENVNTFDLQVWETATNVSDLLSLFKIEDIKNWHWYFYRFQNRIVLFLGENQNQILTMLKESLDSETQEEKTYFQKAILN